MLLYFHVDIIPITETWLNDNINDAEILVNCNKHYNIYLRDRDDTTGIKCYGGDILIAVNHESTSNRRLDMEEMLKIIWVELYLVKVANYS